MNVDLAHRGSVHSHRFFSHTTSTWPSNATSASRCRVRWCTRVENVPQLGQAASTAGVAITTVRSSS
ncbi:hypothetical protein [Nocardioides faecalis]|uniref:hypothetical protein n=1 Tax=Nocardioides faecalis TaxID=2803858 RepID=UPI002016D450|nr:hypothetical protein [Nocardioides faecalis]